MNARGPLSKSGCVPILWALQHDLPFRIPTTLRIGRIRLADPAHWQRVVWRYGIAHLSDRSCQRGGQATLVGRAAHETRAVPNIPNMSSNCSTYIQTMHRAAII